MRPVRRADNLVLKSGSLNLLEPSGPVQTCNGIALPFMYHIMYKNELFLSFLERRNRKITQFNKPLTYVLGSFIFC